MSDIEKNYTPQSVEDFWYEKWKSAHCFQSNVDSSKKPYAIMIPPPNVTGVLTMGHVLNNTIQDILIRRARQEQKSALWLPGTDHAGIATQTKVEKALKEKGTSKDEIGREKFLEEAYKWRDTHGGIIFKQLQKLGCSCDWDRAVHTLDEDYSNAVLTAFVHLFKKGLIYRGNRMTNWCPVSMTALSDEEVIMKPQKSKLYTVKYALAEDPSKFLLVSTTRPETIPGDVALAVNPNDSRYAELVGKKVIRPLNEGEIPIIPDEAVETDFGTGVLKVTPAHDPADFEIGLRHNLPVVDIMNPDGTLNDLAGDEFSGMERFKARKHAAKVLDQKGLLDKEENYDNNVGYSERADVPVEPRISQQWFLKYPRVEEAKKVVEEGLIQFHPKRWEKTYTYWLDNINDWCISRQLWWGHRIPVWYKKNADRLDPENWHVSVEGPQDTENWEQEEDVLDTWASSWLWPFATLGWPNQNEMDKNGLPFFYPTNDLVTGPDIIFFWVARMIMAGLEFMGPDKETLTDEDIKARIPFDNVYFTGIVRDSQGRKMSKSLGNSPDPIELIEKYGADGLRFGIISIAPQGQDVPFSDERIAFGRNFCNKLWNACRFRQMSAPTDSNLTIEAILERINPDLLDSDDHAILSRVLEATDRVSELFEKYEFSAITQEIYALFWNDFCDWYLEVSKSRLKDEETKGHCLAIQDFVIRQVLLLLHPFTPFITESLWHSMNYGKEGDFIQNADPERSQTLKNKLLSKKITLNPQANTDVLNLRDLVSKARGLKASFDLASRKDLNFYFKAEDPAAGLISGNADKLTRLIGAETLNPLGSSDSMPAVVSEIATLYLDIGSAVDVEAERSRLQKEADKLEKLAAVGESKLKSEKFTSKAPAHIVEGAKKQLEETKAKLNEVKQLLNSLA